MADARAPVPPEERDLKRLRRLLSGAIADLETAHRDPSLMKSAPAAARGAPADGERERYDLKKFDAYVDILSKCDQLRRDLYSLPTPRDERETEKERRQWEREEQQAGASYVILSPLEDQETDCPEVEN